MRHERAEVSADNAVPRRAVLLVEEGFDVLQEKETRRVGGSQPTCDTHVSEEAQAKSNSH